METQPGSPHGEQKLQELSREIETIQLAYAKDLGINDSSVTPRNRSRKALPCVYMEDIVPDYMAAQMTRSKLPVVDPIKSGFAGDGRVIIWATLNHELFFFVEIQVCVDSVFSYVESIGYGCQGATLMSLFGTTWVLY